MLLLSEEEILQEFNLFNKKPEGSEEYLKEKAKVYEILCKKFNVWKKEEILNKIHSNKNFSSTLQINIDTGSNHPNKIYDELTKKQKYRDRIISKDLLNITVFKKLNDGNGSDITLRIYPEGDIPFAIVYIDFIEKSLVKAYTEMCNS